MQAQTRRRPVAVVVVAVVEREGRRPKRLQLQQLPRMHSKEGMRAVERGGQETPHSRQNVSRMRNSRSSSVSRRGEKLSPCSIEEGGGSCHILVIAWVGCHTD